MNANIAVNEVGREVLSASPSLDRLRMSTPLETLLAWLAMHGKPRVGMYGSGWHCSVEMNTNTTGASFEIKSDFRMDSPVLAAKQCYERVESALRQLEKGAT